MPRQFADMVLETTTTTGTGTVTLAGATAGYRSFLSAIGASGECWYRIAGQTSDEWEIGYGSIDAGGTSLGRNVVRSSNSDALVSFSAGTKDVSIVEPASVIDPAVQIAGPQKTIQAALDDLPSDGGKVIVMPGTYTITDAIKVKDNTVLELRAGARVQAANSYSPASAFTIGSRTMHCLIQNDDATNGNTNITICGQGRITQEGATGLNEAVSHAGVCFHKCSYCDVRDVEIDNIMYGVSTEGGTGGNERFFSVLFTECTYCTMEGLHAYKTGDDTLGIRRSSTDCAILNCHSHNCKHGHCIQGATSTIFGNVGGVLCQRLRIVGNNCHNAEDLGEEEACITFHSCTDSIIEGNVCQDAGHGIMVLGDSVRVSILNNYIHDPRKGGINIWCEPTVSDNIVDAMNVSGNYIQLVTVGSSGDENMTAGIRFRCTGASGNAVKRVNITNNYIYGADGDYQNGVLIYNDAAYTVEQVNISGNFVYQVGYCGFLIHSGHASAVMRDVNVAGNTAIECGYLCLVYQEAGTCENVNITGNFCRSVRDIGATVTAARGIRVNGATDCVVTGNRVHVAGLGITEAGSANYNTFSGNNARGSGSEFDVNGANSSLARAGKGADAASADEMDLGDTPHAYYDVTGTTTINHITNTNFTPGAVVTLQFDSSVTVTHNSGSPTGTEASILLAGASNFSATASDTLTLVYDGTTFREVARAVI